MREEVVDSNVFLAALVRGDEFHHRAVELVEDMDRGERVFHIPLTVLLEVISTLSRRVGIEEAREAKSILALWINKGKMKVYNLNERRAEAASEIATSHKLKGADAITAQLSRELNTSLLTFDRNVLEAFPGSQKP